MLTRCALLLAISFAAAFEAPVAHAADPYPIGMISTPAPIPSDASVNDRIGARISAYGNLMVLGVPMDRVGDVFEQGSIYVHERAGDRWPRPVRLVAPDGFQGQGFGSSVAVWGNRVVVAATKTEHALSGDDAVYIYERGGAGWTLQARLTAPEPNLGLGFGTDVAISGDTVIIGAASTIGRGVDGRCYIFRRIGGNWLREATLNILELTSTFGHAVALDGNIAVIGAPKEDVSAARNGRVFVFERVGTQWVRRGEPVIQQTGNLSRILDFGADVAISGATIVVGAPSSERNGSPTGASFAFVRTGDQWIQQSIPLFDPAGTSGDYSGGAVAVLGDLALVGAPQDNANGILGAGSALLFQRTGTAWNHIAQPFLPDAGSDDEFGTAVALANGLAIVGAPRSRSYGGTPQVGKVYTFGVVQSSWQLLDRLQLPDGANQDQFGYRMAIDRDTLLVAAPFQERGEVDQAGGVYVYRRRDDDWALEAQLVGPSTPMLGDWFGWSVALRGDTAVVGGIYVDGEVADAGAVYVFTRNGSSWTQTATLRSPLQTAFENFGSSVAIDQLSENRLIVGAWRATADATAFAGAAYVFERVTSGGAWNMRAKLIAPGPQAVSLYGYGVALDGTWAFVSAPYYDTATVIDAGAVYAYELTDVGWTPRASVTVPQSAAGSGNFGYAMALEREGIGHVLYVGAPNAFVQGVQGGGVYRVRMSGPGSGVTSITELPMPAGAAPGDGLGMALALRHGQLLVGAPGIDLPAGGRSTTGDALGSPVVDAGATYLYPDGDPNRARRFQDDNPNIYDMAGNSVVIAGDANMALMGLPGRTSVGFPGRGGASDLLIRHGQVDVLLLHTQFKDGFEHFVEPVLRPLFIAN